MPAAVRSLRALILVVLQLLPKVSKFFPTIHGNKRNYKTSKDSRNNFPRTHSYAGVGNIHKASCKCNYKRCDYSYKLSRQVRDILYTFEYLCNYRRQKGEYTNNAHNCCNTKFYDQSLPSACLIMWRHLNILFILS